MKIERTYIIHRKQDTNRQYLINNLMKNTPCGIFEIVDEDSHLWHQTKPEDEKNLICYWNRKIKLPTVNHYWNMMNIYNDIVKNKYNNVMIYEDDIVITNFNFKEFQIDNSKLFYNLDTFSNFGYIKGNHKKGISKDDFDHNNPKHVLRLLQSGAVFNPTWEKTKEFVEMMEKYREKKKGKFRGFDAEKFRCLKLSNKLNNSVYISESLFNGFHQNENMKSTLGNPTRVIKQFLKKEIPDECKKKFKRNFN